jgi:F-type H+-transporting ATPase subunit c
MEAKALEFFIACVTAAGFGIAIAAFGCGIAQGIGLALIESLCIYALVVALILIFAHPQAASIAALFAHGG